MSTQLVLDETIRTIVREELKKAGLTNFNDEMDARADEKLEEFFNEYDLEEKFTDHCESWIQRNSPETSRFVTAKDFDEYFDNRLRDVTLSR
tara:strand:- start:975 stop:1250 length:276 start_codon:yes stop_codon:yes gene_type:complete